MSEPRLLSVMLLTLVLLAQGALALVPGSGHAMCGMEPTDGMAMPSASDCGHAVDEQGAACIQCSQCSGGHCFAWAMLPTVVTTPVLPDRGELGPALPRQVVENSPARIYRPPRLPA